MCVDLPESGILDMEAGGPGPEAAGVPLVWPVSRPTPPADGRDGSADARGGGGTWHGIVSLRPEADQSSPPDQGVSAAASRMPAAQAAAAAAAANAAAVAAARAYHGAGGGEFTGFGDGGGWGGGGWGGGAAAPAEVREPMNASRHSHNVSTVADRVCVSLPSWCMRAGPRKQIFYDPTRVNAAIVTCGHICPGVNDVVQGIVHRLTDYGVPEGQVLGICDGFKGFDPRHPAKPRPLTRAAMEGAHLRGGSLLGTSKSWADIDHVVHKIEMWEVNMLFVVGGDGGLRAAQLLSEQCRVCGLPCCVVGVPKSIENDILLVDRTFGFETAVQEVQRPLLAAKVEASSIRGGIGLVKVMGRHSGFLAMQASLASGVVDVCLIPEVSFTMDGPHGLLAYVGKVLERKAPRRVDPWGNAWNRLRADTGQPSFHPPPALGRIAPPSSASESDTNNDGNLADTADGVRRAASANSSASSVSGATAASLVSSSISSTSTSTSLDPQGADAAPRGGFGEVTSAAPSTAALDADIMTSPDAEPFGPSPVTKTTAGGAGVDSAGVGGGFLSNEAAAAVVGTAPGVAPAGTVTPGALPPLNLEVQPETAELPWPSPPLPGGAAAGAAAEAADAAVAASPLEGLPGSTLQPPPQQQLPPPSAAAPAGNILPFTADSGGGGEVRSGAGADKDEATEVGDGQRGGNGGGAAGSAGAFGALGAVLRGVVTGGGSPAPAVAPQGPAAEGGNGVSAPPAGQAPHRRHRPGRHGGGGSRADAAGGNSSE
ncbi:hypothetical protein GPECTOR_132g591 [Gonium pectorale]|uniref:Phosphofructokinase domain-containing protein n=1 Tax=Gonium pectorale TaxID=33097 RepID=A0A150FYA4_GONPE|nr:hypothetical protein GPECTOR_132g591 [Gonium pectorale]|eukprot:KXZ42579.1 hypothetical protein GPECTOR_132g591 [Gonium pectorale]